jgi:hypothetical protein
MRRLVMMGGIVLLLVSCKVSKNKCDAYGDADIEDIYKINIEAQKKYCSYTVIK